MGPLRAELDGKRDEQQERRKQDEAEPGNGEVEHALHEEGADGELAAVQRNGGELADILDGGIPGEAVVEVGHDADVDAGGAGLFHERDDELLVGGYGEEDFVDEEGTGKLDGVAHIADDVRVAGFGFAFGEGDEAFEAEAEVAEAFEVIAQGVRDAAGADDEDVAGLEAFAVAAVLHVAPDVAPDAEQHGGEGDHHGDDGAGDVDLAGDVECAAKQQAGDHGGLHGHALLMQRGAVVNGAVEAVGAGKEDQRNAVPGEIEKPFAGGAVQDVREQRKSGIAGSGVEPEPRGHDGGDEDGDEIERSPDERRYGRPLEDARAYGDPAVLPPFGDNDLLEIFRCGHRALLLKPFQNPAA